MKDKWLADLKNKFEGHEDDPPDGLWLSIEKELFPEEEYNVFPLMPEPPSTEKNDDKKHDQKNLKHRIGALSIAAGIAVLVSVIFFLKIQDDDFKNLTGNRTQKKTVQASSLSGSLNTDAIVFSFDIHKKEVNHKAHTTNEKVFSHIRTNKKTKLLEDLSYESLKIQMKEVEARYSYDNISEPLMAGHFSVSEINDKYSLDSLTAEAYSQENLAQTDGDKNRNNFNHKWILGLISGPPSSNSSLSSHQQEGYVMMNGQQLEIPADSGAETEEDPLGEIFAGNRYEDVKTDIRHKLPVKLGLSVSYQLNDQWSVTTGLTYSKLSSDLLSGTDANMIKGEQTVKYIGIPVQINYRIWQKGNISAYASAGAQIEKSIHGKMKTNYIVNHEIKESFSEELTVNSLQMSLNAGGGVQYKLFKNFGIYFEPSLRYNFNDGSEIRTIYREKPLNLNLEFGVRYSIQ